MISLSDFFITRSSYNGIVLLENILFNIYIYIYGKPMKSLYLKEQVLQMS